jgi:hypothetical protein
MIETGPIVIATVQLEFECIQPHDANAYDRRQSVPPTHGKVLEAQLSSSSDQLFSRFARNRYGVSQGLSVYLLPRQTGLISAKTAIQSSEVPRYF